MNKRNLLFVCLILTFLSYFYCKPINSEEYYYFFALIINGAVWNLLYCFLVLYLSKKWKVQKTLEQNQKLIIKFTKLWMFSYGSLGVIYTIYMLFEKNFEYAGYILPVVFSSYTLSYVNKLFKRESKEGDRNN